MSWFGERIKNSKEILVLPGAFDALSARLVALAECEAVYCGGFATTASQFGLPDLGLLGLSDMANIYQRISGAILGKPLIVDGDAGHGGLLNVQRTTQVLAKIGVDAFHLEDQANPKRCGHLHGKDVVNFEDAMARVRAAADAAGVDGPAIIARTDAIAVHGFENAIKRANSFLEYGASAVFIDAPTTVEQIKEIPKLVHGPVIFNAAPTGAGPTLQTAELQKFGYACVIHPIETIMVAMDAVKAEIRNLKGEVATEVATNFSAMNEMLGTQHFLETEQSLATDH